MIKLFKTVLIMTSLATSAIINAQLKTELNPKEKAIVSIAVFAGNGDLEKLKKELNGGLDSGLTVSQIKEELIHIYAYAGFPRSLQGLQTFMTVLDERKSKNITDRPGREASPVKKESEKYARGKAILQELTGIQEKNPKSGYAAFAPTIEIFLKEHLFADIFERDILTYAERELVTISVLSSIGGVEPMLASHFKICFHLGFTEKQLQHFLEIIQEKIGKKEAASAQKVLNEVINSKK